MLNESVLLALQDNLSLMVHLLNMTALNVTMPNVWKKRKKDYKLRKNIMRISGIWSITNFEEMMCLS